MKKKILAALLLVTVHINGMEDTGTRIGKKANKVLVQYRVNQIDKYYTHQSKIKFEGTTRTFDFPLQILERVCDRKFRKLFFEKLLLKNNEISKEGAMSKYLRFVGQLIINVPIDFDAIPESSDSNYVYEPPFLCALVEDLAPITRTYMRKAQMAVK